MNEISSRALFNAIKVAKVKFYEKSGAVEIFGTNMDVAMRERYPSLYKFIYKGKYSLEMAKKIQVNEIVHIEAEIQAYETHVYGKRGLPLHYPDGTLRKTTKVRFRILGIWRGVKKGLWRR